ncbi:hypothetical protein GCM10007897_15300 [Sphingobium jiangsuense]|nr:hypothetical protein GCM10007897_15300 [Sphingobium jiangsuense]
MQPDELKELRKALGLSQQEFADALGVSRVLVGQMERGQAPIERRTALAARYLAEHPDAALADDR